MRIKGYFLFVLMSVTACTSSVEEIPSRTLEEEVLIERIAENSYTFSFSNGGPWHIFAGPSSKEIDWNEPRFAIKHRDTTVSVPFQPRTFWGLVSSSGDTLIASEREIPFDKAINFRDLGGIPTQEGRRVKWGLFYRSGKLHKLSSSDRDQLDKLGIQTVVDFRSDQEVEDEPDHLPKQIAYKRMVIGIDEAIDQDKLMDSLKTMTPSQSANLLLEANKLFASSSAKDYLPFINLLQQEKDIPLVFHCTAGKDRTGFAAALILSALGVSRETIMQDFLMSNYYRAGHGNFRMNFVWLLGLKREVLEPLMEVRPEYLNAAFRTIDSLYGGTNAFLEAEYGITDTVRQEWIEQYTY